MYVLHAAYNQLTDQNYYIIKHDNYCVLLCIVCDTIVLVLLSVRKREREKVTQHEQHVQTVCEIQYN